MLEILITWEKLASFDQTSYQHLLKYSPCRVMLVLLAAATTLNMASLFCFSLEAVIVLDDKTNHTQIMYVPLRSEFSSSPTGQVVENLVFIFRNYIILILLVILNVYLILAIKKYLKIKTNNLLMYSRKNAIRKINLNNQQMDVTFIFINRIEETIDSESIIKFNKKLKRRVNYISRTGKKAILMLFVFCSTSLFENSILTMMGVIGLYYRSKSTNFLLVIGMIFAIAKVSFYFFLFYFFNTKFKKLINAWYKITLLRINMFYRYIFF
jgi:hypothetical protein